MQEQDKVKLYEEVLVQDPASTLFFPLAKLYLQEDRVEGALYVLETGLKYHPAHVEARMLLVRVLQKQGKEVAVREQIAAIAGILRKYPDFWHGWADQLEKEGDSDFALAARFIGLRLSGHQISWCDLIGNALKGLTGESLLNLDQMSFGPASAASQQSEVTPEEDKPQEVLEFVEDFQKTAFPDLESAPQAGEDIRSQPEEAGDASTSESTDEDEFVFRTKTMADILAKQGDYRGARDIYAELAQKSRDERFRRELQDNVNRMQRLMDERTQEESRAESQEPAREGSDTVRDFSGDWQEETSDLKSVLELEGDREEGLDDAPDAGDGRGFLPYRTRTMADILVQQGDYREARAIYSELREKSQDPQTSSDLQAQIDLMDRYLGEAGHSGSEGPGKEGGRSDRAQVIDVLQKLASNLESRPKEEADPGRPSH